MAYFWLLFVFERTFKVDFHFPTLKKGDFVSAKMVDFLKNKFEEIKRVNSAFSIRTFAIHAGISSGAMTDILNGRRTSDSRSEIVLNLGKGLRRN